MNQHFAPSVGTAAQTISVAHRRHGNRFPAARPISVAISHRRIWRQSLHLRDLRLPSHHRPDLLGKAALQHRLQPVEQHPGPDDIEAAVATVEQCRGIGGVNVFEAESGAAQLGLYAIEGLQLLSHVGGVVIGGGKMRVDAFEPNPRRVLQLMAKGMHRLWQNAKPSHAGIDFDMDL